MKKIYALMIMAGLILAVVTAGGVDAGVIGVNRLMVQALFSSVLMLSGTHFSLRGEA